jgi:hypothetical protein
MAPHQRDELTGAAVESDRSHLESWKCSRYVAVHDAARGITHGISLALRSEQRHDTESTRGNDG